MVCRRQRLRIAAMSGRVRKSSNYEVGYGRPPIATRFAAGNRANPNGRPRGSRSVGAVLQDIMRQKIAVSENGKTRRIPTLEVILRRLANDAMRSNPAAVKLLISFVDRYADSSRAAPRLNDLLAEDKAILARYLPDLAPNYPSKPDEAENDDEL
jgi:uncharacterized protein DUF5681